MITYGRIPTKNKEGAEGFRYTKNGLMTKESRVPHEVMEKFEYTPTIEYDDAPERRRCITCDAPQSRQKYLDGFLHDLCEYHYQHMTLGQISAQVRQNKLELDKFNEKFLKTPKKKKHRSHKTALSKIIE